MGPWCCRRSPAWHSSWYCAACPAARPAASLCLTPSISRGRFAPAERSRVKSNKNAVSPSPACLPAGLGLPFLPVAGRLTLPVALALVLAARCRAGLGTCSFIKPRLQRQSAEAVGAYIWREGCQRGAGPRETQHPPVIILRVLGQPGASHTPMSPLAAPPPSPPRESPEHGSVAALRSSLPSHGNQQR